MVKTHVQTATTHTNNMHYNTYSQEELQHEVLQMPQEEGTDTGWLNDEVRNDDITKTDTKS